jgi:solute carrier family 6 amino acid transporter-like protein 5/7/9/14
MMILLAFDLQVVYVTAIVPYIILTIFLVRGCMLEGSYLGVLSYVTPDWSRLADASVST